MASMLAQPGLTDLLRQAIARGGDHRAIHHAGLDHSFRELGSAIEDKIAVYRAAGVNGNSLVGVVASEPLAFLSDVFALLALEATVVLLALVAGRCVKRCRTIAFIS